MVRRPQRPISTFGHCLLLFNGRYWNFLAVYFSVFFGVIPVGRARVLYSPQSLQKRAFESEIARKSVCDGVGGVSLESVRGRKTHSGNRMCFPASHSLLLSRSPSFSLSYAVSLIPIERQYANALYSLPSPLLSFRPRLAPPSFSLCFPPCVLLGRLYTLARPLYSGSMRFTWELIVLLLWNGPNRGESALASCNRTPPTDWRAARVL
jgi:hypothetical protein